MKILIVEDDEAISQLLQQVLAIEDHIVDIVTNGREALDYLEKMPRPKLILLDMTMPVMDGFEFRQKQLGSPQFSEIPVLLMTADSHVSLTPLQLKTQQLLRKPLSIDDVLEKVRVALAIKNK